MVGRSNVAFMTGRTAKAARSDTMAHAAHATSPSTSEPEKRLGGPSSASLRLARMMMLEKAAELLGGKDAVARAIGIETRSLRSKLTADRGISASDLQSVAEALDARAADVARFAAKVREIIA